MVTSFEKIKSDTFLLINRTKVLISQLNLKLTDTEK